jgi:beta-lactamase class A
VRQWDTVARGLVSDAALVGLLDNALIGVDGHVSIAVKDLGSGRGAALEAERELPAASLYKLPILYAVFDAGLGMGEELPITEETRAYDAGTMELGVGETLSVAEALERMITISDNTAAVMLGSRVGGGRINATVAALGMDSTHYSLERMTTSALDMLHFLDLLARGKAVSASASAEMVNLMLRQRVNDRLPRLLPGGVRVAHKTGNLPGTVNDVGIVYGPTTTLAIAALISDTTDETSAAAAIARVGQVAYTYFDDLPEDPNRPILPRAPTRPIPPVWREPKPTPTPTPTPTLEPTAEPTQVPATATPVRTSTATSPPTAGPTGANVKPTPTPAPTGTPQAAAPIATLAAVQPARPTSSPPTPPGPGATATPAARR